MRKPTFLLLLTQTMILALALLFHSHTVQKQVHKQEKQHRKEMQALSAQMASLSLQLQALTKASSKTESTPAKEVEVSIKDREIIGAANAPVTIVEFTDYQCPFCKRFTVGTLPALKTKFIDTGKVKLLIKDLAISGHKYARKAAQASRCAGEQGHYWAMHDLLFANSKNLAEENLIQLAKTLKLDDSQFQKCLDSDRHVAAIDTDIAEAIKLGINGTPAFVIGYSKQEKAGEIQGQILVGAKGVDIFSEKIERLANSH